MDVMRDLLLEFKRNCPKEDFSYHKECEGLINYVIHNMTKSHLPDVEPQQKNDEESRKYREEGDFSSFKLNNLIYFLFQDFVFFLMISIFFSFQQ